MEEREKGRGGEILIIDNISNGVMWGEKGVFYYIKLHEFENIPLNEVIVR